MEIPAVVNSLLEIGKLIVVVPDKVVTVWVDEPVEDGTVAVPKVLQPYMNGMTVIQPEAWFPSQA